MPLVGPLGGRGSRPTRAVLRKSGGGGACDGGKGSELGKAAEGSAEALWARPATLAAFFWPEDSPRAVRATRTVPSTQYYWGATGHPGFATFHPPLPGADHIGHFTGSKQETAASVTFG